MTAPHPTILHARLAMAIMRAQNELNTARTALLEGARYDELSAADIAWVKHHLTEMQRVVAEIEKQAERSAA